MTSPNELLLPAIDPGGASTPVQLVGNISAPAADIWAWATGERPLSLPAPGGEEQKRPRRQPPRSRTTTRNNTETQLFKVSNAPHRWTGS
jgi:hypothetical protein